ncbi:tyrosine-type recombinase/integrase [Thiohalospira halophila]|nr:site-specific integrase [Thiohalospira halophila]
MKQALERAAVFLAGSEVDAATLPWERLRYEHTQALRTHFAELYSPATANRYLSAVRGVLQEAWRLGLVDSETYHRAVDLEPVRGSRATKGRALSVGEARAIFEVCAQDASPAGARDAACFGLAYGLGLRRAEIAGLSVEDWEQEEMRIIVRGKGNKERTVYADDGTAAAIEDWLAIRGGDSGPLLVAVRKSGNLVHGRHLTDQAIYQILRRRQQEAGTPPFTPHDLRRTYGGDLLDAGADLATVQKLMGHAKPDTTSGYDRRGERAKKRASGMRHTPYPGAR